MTWILNDNSYMTYINNINQNAITLNDQSKCGICTGNIITQLPSLSPTLYPSTGPIVQTTNPTPSSTNIPSFLPTGQPTLITSSPTALFPYCNDNNICKNSIYHSNTSFIQCGATEACDSSTFHLYEYANINCTGARACQYAEIVFFFLFIILN